MRRNPRKKKFAILLLLLVCVVVGYAAISTQLKINGLTVLQKQTWSVYWDNPVVTAGSVTEMPPMLTSDDTVAIWSAELGFPGEFYEFTIDAVNEGSIDAKIKAIEPEITPEKPDYINYSVTYENGDPLEVGHILAKASNGEPTRETYKVRVEFDPDATMEDYMAIDEVITYEYKFSINYGQANYTPSQNAPAPKPKEPDCPGEECVYTAIVYGKQYYGYHEDKTTLTGYSKNYKDIKGTGYKRPGSNQVYGDSYTCYEENNYNDCEEVEAQASLLLGYVLDDDDKINRAFLCRVLSIETPNEKVVCFEGTTGKKKFAKNVQKLEDSYDTYNIEEYYAGGYSSPNESDPELSIYPEGTIHFYRYEADSCDITPNGIIYCYVAS